MTSDLLQQKGTPLERQRFTWREMVPKPISKLDDDAFTRVRIILMNGLETDALRTKHGWARMNAASTAASNGQPSSAPLASHCSTGMRRP